MTKKGSKVMSWLLALVLCFCMLPIPPAYAADAMSLNEVKLLLNEVEPQPQRTGYIEMDQLLEEILRPYAEADNYTKIKAMYDWTVRNVKYSWEGYSQQHAPAYDKFTLSYNLTYETGLPEAIPEEIINRSYHALTAKKGVCYDYAALFAVMARYVGFESYVHTGILRKGSWQGHHGWTVIKLRGENVIFDTQQDNRSVGSGGSPYAHFGISPVEASRFTPETKVNAARDAGFLPVTAERVRQTNVTVNTSRSGAVAGGGACVWGEPVTLTSANDVPVVGWYDADGTLLSEESSYTLTPEGDTTINAMFKGDYYFDVPANTWYTEDVCGAAELGLVQGETATTFVPDGNMTRATLAAALYRMEGADASGVQPVPLSDVPQDAWYAPAVNWAYANGIVNGVSETSFDPMGTVTREEAAAMMVRFLERPDSQEPENSSDVQEPEAALEPAPADGVQTSGEALEQGSIDSFPPPDETPDSQGADDSQQAATSLDYTDADEIDDFAREPIAKAQALGLLKGYTDGSIRPKQKIIRSEGTVMVMRLCRYIVELQQA